MVASQPAATVVTAILRCDFCAAKLHRGWKELACFVICSYRPENPQITKKLGGRFGYFIFPARGRGRGSPRLREGGVARIFNGNSQEGGGGSPGGWGLGGEGLGGCLRGIWGGGVYQA